MPGLLRGVARTAVVAGTATAVSGRVRRRQAARYTEKDAQLAADRTQAYQRDMGYTQQPQSAPQQYAQPAPAPSYLDTHPAPVIEPVAAAEPAPAATSEADIISQLQQLGELRDNGILTPDEFDTQKARILGS